MVCYLLCVSLCIIDDSLFSLKGMNRINEEASDSDTYLGGHALLLGDSARANVIPGLEIENRNVVAKHLAAVAPIDEDQIFYLNSRGLDRNDAIELIITGILEEIISGYLAVISFKIIVTIRISIIHHSAATCSGF